MSDFVYSVLIVVVIAAVTAFIRIIPFIIFERGGEPPKFINYLGKVLPPALMSFLLLYCVKGIHFDGAGNWMPDIIAICVAMALHIWKRNTFLSIGVSTILYMILVQIVFI